MKDDHYSLLWLKSISRDGNRLLNSDVSIDCFPYGVTTELESTLDLIEDSKPTFFRLAYWMVVVVAILAIGFFVAYGVFTGLFVGLFVGLSHVYGAQIKVSAFLFWVLLLLGLLLPLALVFKYAGRHWRMMLEENIGTKCFKVKRIIAGSSNIQIVLQKQLPFTIPWSALSSIKLSNLVRNKLGNATIVFDGPTFKQPLHISLTAIHTYENWMSLAQAVHTFAPHVSIDDGIARALTLPSSEASFTELWLDSLSSAPEQDSLQAIPVGQPLHSGRYIVKARLASGGQGHAYLGEDTLTSEEVVIKGYLLPIYQGKRVKDQAIHQLESEAVVLQRIDHPQIVQFIDWFCESNRAFLVLKRIQGVNLRQWLSSSGCQSQELITDLAMQMCCILSYLHTSKPLIIHRDFTPDNLIIDAAHKLTLIDFTIAEPCGSTSGLPPAGKPAYMPPEQFRGETCAQSDIYAFGGTLFFLLTGHDPEALEQSNFVNWPHLSVLPLLAQIVYKCRAQEVDDRFKSIDEVHELLSQPSC